MISLLLALAGLITFLVIDSNKSNPVVEVLEECGTAHEGYNLTSLALIGNYTQYAVAVDNPVCSTIGRWIIKKIQILILTLII